ncbi:unnamed protein product, partial [Ectocarpus sp. 6 AP-2014]
RLQAVSLLAGLVGKGEVAQISALLGVLMLRSWDVQVRANPEPELLSNRQLPEAEKERKEPRHREGGKGFALRSSRRQLRQQLPRQERARTGGSC